MKAALAIGALALVGGSAWMGQGQWQSPWLALAAASLVAGGTWLGVALGALALSVSALVFSAPEWTLLGGLGLVAGGVALGLLARDVERTAPWALTSGSVRTGACIAGGLAGLTVLPDARLLLLDASGAPLELMARLQDPTARVAGLVHLPAVMESAVPGRELLILAGALALLAGFVLMRLQVTDPGRDERLGWSILGVAGGLVGLAGILGLAQLLSGDVDLPDAGAWALSLSKAGQGIAVTGVEVAPDARLGLASRPLVDLLRLVIGASVLVWSFGPWRRQSVTRLTGPRTGLLLAIGAACLAALFSPTSVSAVLVGGSGVLFFSVLIAQNEDPESRLGADLAGLVLIAWLAGWLTPAWTGIFV
ncbi:MAG: hypothetical protein CL940_08705 [Deltaproteobacteria bacterium]|nr:hypothetical protein [Deltaproteobacteria bacterium]